eukprot:1729712-Rhodomonas_salina.2
MLQLQAAPRRSLADCLRSCMRSKIISKREEPNEITVHPSERWQQQWRRAERGGVRLCLRTFARYSCLHA